MSYYGISKNASILKYLLGYLLLVQMKEIQSSQECQESEILSIPLCHPGAHCFQLPFSYSCQWIEKSHNGRKSPYVAVDYSQPDVPKMWHLVQQRPAPVNECSESDKIRIKLCRSDAKCVDLPRGYQCVFENGAINNGNPYLAKACEAQTDLNWICVRYVESVITIENELSSNRTKSDDLRMLENRLNDVLNILQEDIISQKTLEIVRRDMNASLYVSRFAMNKAERDPSKGSVLFTKSILVAENAINNYARKIQNIKNSSYQVSHSVGDISLVVKFIQSTFHEIDHTFPDSEDHVIIRIEPTQSLTKDVAISFTKVNENRLFFDLWKESSGSNNIISSIIGANVYEEVDAVIIVTFTHRNVEKEENAFKRCVSWDVHDSTWTDNPSWRYGDCVVVNSTGNDKTTCECRQSKQKKLTHVGLLLDLVEKKHSYPVFVTTQIFCWLCVLSFTVLLISFLLLEIHKSNRILIYFCVGILFGNLFYLFGTYLTGVSFLCLTVAILTHYCFLLAFTWSVIFFIQLVCLVFGERKSIKIRIYTLLGFTIPAIIVIISWAVNREHYGSNGRSCLFSNTKEVSGSLIAPVLVAILLNFINLTVFVYIVLRASERIRTSNPRISIWLRGLEVTGFMALIWTCAVLMSQPEIGVFYAYLFAIFNGLQGVLILSSYVLLSKQTRDKLYLVIRERISVRRTPAPMQGRALPIPLPEYQTAQEAGSSRTKDEVLNLDPNEGVYENSNKEDAYEETDDQHEIYDDLDTVYTSPTIQG